ncbi:MAG: LLM class F420-dependent oxidoreductase [Acidimicrobiia bacterium]
MSDLRIGVIITDNLGLDALTEYISGLAQLGLHSAWMAQTFAADALTQLALVGRVVPGIELGTAVVPTYPRHPLMLASQALTVQAAIGGRLALGVGLSHKPVIEKMYGYSFDKPARHMSEYLSVLIAIRDNGTVRFRGETLTASTFMPVQVEGATPFPILLAAMGDKMLELAGAVGDGTITWMTGPHTLTDHIVPKLHAAAAAAQRPVPRTIAGLPILLTADVDAARETAATEFAHYGQLPSYRAMLDREGAAGPADVAIIGDEQHIGSRIATLCDTGLTDFIAVPFGPATDQRRTLELLASL